MLAVTASANVMAVERTTGTGHPSGNGSNSNNEMLFDAYKALTEAGLNELKQEQDNLINQINNMQNELNTVNTSLNRVLTCNDAQKIYDPNGSGRDSNNCVSIKSTSTSTSTSSAPKTCMYGSRRYAHGQSRGPGRQCGEIYTCNNGIWGKSGYNYNCK